MKAIRVLKPDLLELQDIPEPHRHKGEVRIRIERVGICGSDMGIIRGLNPFVRYPITPGHEFSGRVMETDPDSDFTKGELVAVRPILTCGSCEGCLAQEQNHCMHLKVLGVHQDGAYAEQIALPKEVVKKVPEGMSAEQAALIEPTAVAVHINRRAQMASGKKVAVIGAGVIGNLVFQVSKAKGTDRILAIDRVEQRLPLAQEVGADWAINSAEIDPITFAREHVGDGFDIVFDLVGTEATAEQAIQMAKPGGTVVLIAVPHTQWFSFNYQEVFRKELALVGSRLYDDRDFQEAISLLSSGQVQAERLVTHRLPLSQGIEAIELVRKQPDIAFKVMLEMD